MSLTVGDIRRLLTGQGDDLLVGIHVDGDPQGHSLMQDEGWNSREDIFWFRASKEED